MPLPTPFHTRTAPLCSSWEWRDWSGYLAPSLYEPVSHEREYFAIRNSAGLIDISPLFKYEVIGQDAEQAVDRIMTRDISRCAVGQVLYSPWCDDDGKVIDDCTIARLAPEHFRITAAQPNLRWFQDLGSELDVQIKDVSNDWAALALQGPKSRAILKELFPDAGLDTLGYFHLTHTTFANTSLTITRTGYTGDLGYELWLRPSYAEQLWDHLMAVGARYNILPVGLVALDIVRIEAGFMLIEVDYIPAKQALIPAQKSSPYELGLGWTVNLKGSEFIGKYALQDERVRGSKWSFVGLEIDWFELERLYNAVGLRPHVAGMRASRLSAPIYVDGRQVGQATSHVFSPLLKKYIALATIEKPYARAGTPVYMEMTVEFRREKANATVVKRPFFNPPRKVK